MERFNSQWLWRPRTLFSENCFNDLHQKLDQFLPELKKGENGYPMNWSLFGSIHHPNVYKFRKNILKTLPKEDTKFRNENYQ